MFIGNMVTEAIPIRVYSLYKIALGKREITRAEIQRQMEPEGIYEGNSYFPTILKTAIELKESINNIDEFRMYTISKLNNFEDEQFFKFTNAIVNLNEKVYAFSNIADPATTLNVLSSQIGQQLTPPMARGWRFWAQFLGFGYMDDMAFLPNAYIYVKNVLKLLQLEKGMEYEINDFMAKFNQYGKILCSNLQPERNMNIALSSALRELHENNEIELKYGSDTIDGWTLFPSNESFNEQISSIIYKGVRK